MLTRVTVNVVPKALRVLEEAAATEGLGKTDAINRALVLYGLLAREVMAGSKLHFARTDGTRAEVLLPW